MRLQTTNRLLISFIFHLIISTGYFLRLLASLLPPDNSYEARIYDGDQCTCHVGVSVSDDDVDSAFTLMRLPASVYAAFEVYVASGYDSENDAMDEWLEANKEKYSQLGLMVFHM